MCEESKLPEHFESQLLENDLLQCEYLFSKYVPIKSIITLGPKSLVIKNGQKLCCIRIVNNNLNSILVENGKRKRENIFESYYDLIHATVKDVF